MLLLARVVRTMQPINLLTGAILEKTAVLVVVATVVNACTIPAFKNCSRHSRSAKTDGRGFSLQYQL